MKQSKRYWYVTRRFHRYDGTLDAYGYDVMYETELNGRKYRRAILRSDLSIPRSKIRKLVKVLNGDL